jgi:hypothetical protein
MLKDFKGPVKLKGLFKKIVIPGVTCPYQGLLIDITSNQL